VERNENKLRLHMGGSLPGSWSRPVLEKASLSTRPTQLKSKRYLEKKTHDFKNN